MSKTTIGDRGSEVTKGLEAAWRILRKVVPGLPHAVLVPMTAGDRRRRWGYEQIQTWRRRDTQTRAHEVAVNPDLFGDPAGLLAVLVHEAAHLLTLKDKGGCTGRYHRKEFRNACVKLGLECEFSGTGRGWTLTNWPTAVPPARYRRVLAKLRKLPYGTGAGGVRLRPVKGKATPAPGLTRLACSCPVASRCVYANASTVKRGAIQCLLCGSLFAPAK